MRAQSARACMMVLRVGPAASCVAGRSIRGGIAPGAGVRVAVC